MYMLMHDSTTPNLESEPQIDQVIHYFSSIISPVFVNLTRNFVRTQPPNTNAWKVWSMYMNFRIACLMRAKCVWDLNPSEWYHFRYLLDRRHTHIQEILKKFPGEFRIPGSSDSPIKQTMESLEHNFRFLWIFSRLQQPFQPQLQAFDHLWDFVWVESVSSLGQWYHYTLLFGIYKKPYENGTISLRM